jgi:hypothetical protein
MYSIFVTKCDGEWFGFLDRAGAPHQHTHLSSPGEPATTPQEGQMGVGGGVVGD